MDYGMTTHGRPKAEKNKHRPLFPAYKHKPTERTLAVYEQQTIYTEDGEVLPAGSLVEVMNALFDYNLLLFVSSIVGLPFLDDMVHNDHCKVMCTRHGLPTMVMVSHKSERRFIVKAEMWNGEIGSQLLVNSRML